MLIYFQKYLLFQENGKMENLHVFLKLEVKKKGISSKASQINAATEVPSNNFCGPKALDIFIIYFVMDFLN